MATLQQKPRRPALQINTCQVPNSKIASSRKVAMVDPRDPTAFNTLSNVYATVVDRSTPVQPEPITAINTRQPLSIQTTIEVKGVQQRTQTPYAPTYPETPLTANPRSPMNNPEFIFPSTMTATPPLSAGPVDNQAPSFTFAPADTAPKLSLNTALVRNASNASNPRAAVPASPRTPRRSRTHPIPSPPNQPPYTHPRTLHSILRNSPLPPSTANKTPMSPRRQSLRLQEKAAKRVGYNNPLTQTITNNKYIFSHIDLLAEDASPSPLSPTVHEDAACQNFAAGGNDTRDGGMTPGPLEDMRRKMAGLGTSSPLTGQSGVRKRRRKEKRRQWTWTINQEEDDEEVGGAIAAIRAAEAAKGPLTPNPSSHTSSQTPTAINCRQQYPLLQPRVYIPNRSQPPPVQQVGSGERSPSLASLDSHEDIEMSDSSDIMSDDSRAVTPEELESGGGGMDLDELTPLEGKGRDDVLTPVVVRRESLRGDSPVPPGL